MQVESGWYGVRCVTVNASPGQQRVYEERVTIWLAGSFEEAIAKAEDEARQYAEDIGDCEYTGFADAYAMVDSPGEGAEVYSLCRSSDLDVDAYLDRFLADGNEAGMTLEG